MITCPKTRPSGAPPTHAAKASRESAATFSNSGRPGRASNNGLLRHCPTGGYETRHGRVRSDGGAVVDRLVAQDRNLAAQAEVLGDRLAGVPALRDEQRDQDHVLRLDTIDDPTYLGILVQEPNLDEVVDAALPDAPGVEVDDAAGVLVQVGPVAEQDEGRASRDRPSAHEVVRTLQDDVGHPLEGTQRSGVADGLPAFPGDGPLKTELPRDDLLGEISFGDKGGDYVDLFRLHGVEHVAHGGLLFPEALDDLVEFSGLPDAAGMLVDGQARVFVEVRTVSHDDQSPHAPPLPPIVQPDSTNRENRLGERLHLPVAGLSLWLRASGPYSRATRNAAAMTGYSVVVGERRGSARSRPPRLAIPSRPRLEWTPPAFKTPFAMRETSSASWRPARPATSRSGTSERTSR